MPIVSTRLILHLGPGVGGFRLVRQTTRLPDIDLYCVFLLRARGAASVGDVLIEELGQPCDNFGMLILDILFLADVFRKIIELDGRQCGGVGLWRGSAPPSRTGTQLQLPVSLPD